MPKKSDYENNSPFTEYLGFIIKKSGMTMNEIIEKSYLSPSKFYNIRTGRTISDNETILSIAKACNATQEEELLLLMYAGMERSCVNNSLAFFTYRINTYLQMLLNSKNYEESRYAAYNLTQIVSILKSLFPKEHYRNRIKYLLEIEERKDRDFLLSNIENQIKKME